MSSKSPPDMLGNWLIYSELALPLLWLGEKALAYVLQRLTRRQRAFPVIITDAQLPRPHEQTDPPTEG